MPWSCGGLLGAAGALGPDDAVRDGRGVDGRDCRGLVGHRGDHRHATRADAPLAASTDVGPGRVTNVDAARCPMAVSTDRARQ